MEFHLNKKNRSNTDRFRYSLLEAAVGSVRRSDQITDLKSSHSKMYAHRTLWLYPYKIVCQ